MRFFSADEFFISHSSASALSCVGQRAFGYLSWWPESHGKFICLHLIQIRHMRLYSVTPTTRQFAIYQMFEREMQTC